MGASTAVLNHLENRFETVITEIPGDITKPNEVLRYFQSKIHRGRPLDISDDAVPLDNDTNFISVDRGNVLKTTFEELKRSKTLLQHLKWTFMVDEPRIVVSLDENGWIS